MADLEVICHYVCLTRKKNTSMRCQITFDKYRLMDN
nr:MAG TPA: hypothetical protein [Caudoviricetes sp.]